MGESNIRLVEDDYDPISDHRIRKERETRKIWLENKRRPHLPIPLSRKINPPRRSMVEVRNIEPIEDFSVGGYQDGYKHIDDMAIKDLLRKKTIGRKYPRLYKSSVWRAVMKMRVSEGKNPIP